MLTKIKKLYINYCQEIIYKLLLKAPVGIWRIIFDKLNDSSNFLYAKISLRTVENYTL